MSTQSKAGRITLFEQNGTAIQTRRYETIPQRKKFIDAWKAVYGYRFRTMFYDISPSLMNKTMMKAGRVELAKELYEHGWDIQEISKDLKVQAQTIEFYLGVREKKRYRKRFEPKTDTCEWCKKLFEQTQRHQRFCTVHCSNQHHNDKKRQLRMVA